MTQRTPKFFISGSVRINNEFIVNKIMSVSDILKKYEENFQRVIEHFTDELVKIRTGRANAALVEGILVDYYGSKSPLKQIASINIPEPRLINIQPWDKGSLANIEAAIRKSDLGVNPVNDGQIIRLAIPPLNEERRIELSKFLSKMAEESKVSVRNIREDIWKEIQEKEKKGELSEDEKFRGKEALQKAIDEYNKKIEEIREKKEKEIMTV